MGAPWLSVLCVIKDDPEGLGRTLTSLRQQDTEGVEVVIVDSSTDATDVPRLLDELGIAHSYSWIEPRGIYPAMNHGLELANGNLTYFANAGDEFFAPDVLERVRPRIADAAWAFGPIEIVEDDGSHVITPVWDYPRERAKHFSRGFFPAHQGTFARTSLLRSLGGFDTSFDVAADYAMALKLSTVEDPVQIPFVIARFYEGGTSTRLREQSFREFHRARVSVFGLRGFDLVREKLSTSSHRVKFRVARALRRHPIRGTQP